MAPCPTENGSAVLIQVTGAPIYEPPAHLLAWLAYPDDASRRGRLWAALCRKAIEEQSRDRSWSDQLQTVRPSHLIGSLGAARKEFETGLKIISRERLPAGLLATHMLAKWAIVEQKVDLLAVAWAKSLTDAAATIEDRRAGKGSDGHNFLGRKWAPSKPVVHVAASLHRWINQVSPLPDRRGVDIGDVLFDSTSTGTILSDAELFRPVLCMVLGIDSTELLHFTMA